MMVTGIRSEFKIVFNLLQYLPVRKVQDVLRTRSRINSYGTVAIERLKQLIQKSPDASNSLFARFLDPSRHQTELTDFQFAQEAANLIVAGSDTTSISLTYLTYALLRPCNKHVRAKLMDEISTVPIDAPAKDILMLPYLKQVIQESLRIYGGGPSLPREVPPSGATLAGYNIPVGTTVSTQTFTLMRDPQTFHDPLSFIPERWHSPTQEMKAAFSPFLTGLRTCLGLHLAMFEITCGILTLLKTCPSLQIAPTMRDEDMDFENYFLMAPKGHALTLTLE